MLSTCQHATIVFISALLPLAGSFSTGFPRVPTAHHARIAAPQLCQPQNSPWDEINRFATSAFKHVEETLQPQFPPPEPASEAVPEPRSVARHAPVKAADTATIIDKPIEIEEAVAAVKPLLDETAPPPVTVSVTPVDVTLVTPVPAPAPAPAPAPVPEPQPERRSGPLLKVVGIGGGGCSTVSRLPHALGAHLGEGVELVMVNTDAQALERDAVTAVEAAAAAAASDSDSDDAFSAAAAEAAITSFQMGEAFLYGQGAGGRPAWGADAAEAEADKLRAELEGADMVFLTAGMGGGTGSGAAPVVARIAKEAGCLTVAVVSSPFGFEGGARADVADGAIGALSAEVDVLVVMKNERLLTMLPPGLTVKQALHAADEIARQAIVGVASLVAANQLINVDMADVRSVMENAGPGLISLGRASGNGRANAAVEAALTSPLLDIKLERGMAPAPARPPLLSLARTHTRTHAHVHTHTHAHRCPLALRCCPPLPQSADARTLSRGAPPSPSTRCTPSASASRLSSTTTRRYHHLCRHARPLSPSRPLNLSLAFTRLHAPSHTFARARAGHLRCHGRPDARARRDRRHPHRHRLLATALAAPAHLRRVCLPPAAAAALDHG